MAAQVDDEGRAEKLFAARTVTLPLEWSSKGPPMTGDVSGPAFVIGVLDGRGLISAGVIFSLVR